MIGYKVLTTAAVTSLALASVPAQAATTLLNLVNAPGQTDTPFVLAFVANASAVTLSVGGYQVPAFEQASQNAVRLGNVGPNLLGSSWTFTPAPSGSLAGQFVDGSGVNALSFGGVSEGSYDVFSQTFATMAGSSYSYSFLYSNNFSPSNSPSGFRVSVDGASVAGAVPEPATWALMLLGFAVIGTVMRRRQKVTLRYA